MIWYTWPQQMMIVHHICHGFLKTLSGFLGYARSQKKTSGLRRVPNIVELCKLQLQIACVTFLKKNISSTMIATIGTFSKFPGNLSSHPLGLHSVGAIHVDGMSPNDDHASASIDLELMSRPDPLPQRTNTSNEWINIDQYGLMFRIFCTSC